jgi:hypothetical protein
MLRVPAWLYVFGVPLGLLLIGGLHRPAHDLIAECVEHHPQIEKARYVAIHRDYKEEG